MKQLFTQDSINFCRSVRLFSVGSEFHGWFEINVTLRQESNEARLEQDFANYHFVSSLIVVSQTTGHKALHKAI